MSQTLYLDTARLGLMSPSAQQLQFAFTRLASDPHGLLYFSEFLSRGVDGCPRQVRDRFAGLSAWRGVDQLNHSIRRLTRAPSDAPVLLASRSATLMQIGIGQLKAHCRKVLTVDLLWPPYRRLLTASCRQSGLQLVVCPLRTAALVEEAPAQDLATRICETYAKHRCDSLVLPLIDNRGVALPVGEIVHNIRTSGETPNQVIVDASQAMGHVPIDVTSLDCDLLIGGAHKWVGGYHPLGIGVISRAYAHIAPHLLRGDPVLRLTQEAAGSLTPRHGETAAILPLLTAAGALADLERTSVEERLGIRLENRRWLTDVLAQASWCPIRAEMQGYGILLARPPAQLLRRGGLNLRKTFRRLGIALTSYANGLVRFSLPYSRFTQTDLLLLRTALVSRSAGLKANHPITSLDPKGTFPCPTVESTTARPAALIKPMRARSDTITQMVTSYVTSASLKSAIRTTLTARTIRCTIPTELKYL